MTRHGHAVLHAEALVPIVRAGALADAWWNYSYSPIYDDGGDIAGTVLVATEVTNEYLGRRRLQEAIAEADVARQELQGIFMQAPVALALLRGPTHVFMLANPLYQKLVGRDVVGKPVVGAFTDDEVAYYVPILDRVFQTGEPHQVHAAPLRLPDTEGLIEERFIDVGYHPHHAPDGTIDGVLAIVLDVTEQVRARHASEDARSVAEASNRTKDEFLATISHELRTPLNAILGWASLLRRASDAKSLEKGLTTIERNAKMQARLIDDVLDVSRIVSGKLRLDMHRVDMRAVAIAALDVVRPAAEAKRVHLSADLPAAGALALAADSDRVQQVLWNLLSNAVKFTPPDGTVSLTVERFESVVRIVVRDTGTGIADEHLAHVFERFRQADSATTRRYGGLGLGLAIVRHLVELHGGSVSAESGGPGQGATFTVLFPIRAVHETTAAAAAGGNAEVAAPPANDHVPPMASLNGVNVLVVEDDEDSRHLLETVLERFGASVSTVSSARAGLEHLQSYRIDVLISDIGMPDEDGVSLMRRVRALPDSRGGSVPAIALTAFARDEDISRALAAGYQRHLAKPADIDSLIQTVASLLKART